MIDLNIINNNFSSNKFSILFERSAGTFIDNTSYHDCCEFLTGSAGQQNFTPVTINDALEVVSTSTNDSAAGIGTRTVGIIYLDPNGNWSEFTATLNGTTPVSLSDIQASAIISMFAKTGGTSLVSVGTINLRKVGSPTIIYEQITAGGNQSQSGRFTVPTGYIALLDDLHVSVQGQSIEIKLRTTRSQFDGSTVDRFQFRTGVKLAAGDTAVLPVTNLKLDAGQSLKISGIADATGGNPRVHGSIDLDLIKL